MFGDGFWETLWDKLVELIYDICINITVFNVSTTNTSNEAYSLMANDIIVKTPQSWNPALFQSLRNISDTAIVPIAIGIMSIVICYDLITVCIDRNNFKEFDTSIFFKFIIKAWVAIYLINNVFEITGAFFEIGANIAETATNSMFEEALSPNAYFQSDAFKEALRDKNLIDLLVATTLSELGNIISIILIIIVLIVSAGRMMEVLVYFTVAPIPFATMTNKEWSGVGFSFIRNMLALALQAFFVVIILSIYTLLYNTNVINSLTDASSFTGAMFSWVCYGVVCCFMLLKTGSISKSICGAH